MTVCIGTAPFALAGASPGGGSYSGPGVSAGTFSPAVAGLGTHNITYTESSCTCSFTITVNSVNTWLGVNNDWFNPANWSCGVPTSGVDVQILPGGAHPIISALTAETRSLLVSSGALLQVQSRLDVLGNLILQGQMQSAPTSSVHFRGGGTRIIDGMPGPLPLNSFFDVFVELDPGAGLGFGAGLTKVNANNVFVQNGIVTAPVEIEMVQLELTGGTYNAGPTTRLNGDYVRTGTAVFNHGNGELIFGGSGSRDILSNFPVESFFDIFIDLAPTGSAAFSGMTKVNARNVNLQEGTVNIPVEIEMVQLNLTGGTFNAGPKTTLNGGYSRSGGTFSPGTGELVIKGPGAHPIHSDFPLESFFDITYDIPGGTSNFPGVTTKVMAHNVKLIDGAVTMPVEIEMVQLDLQGGTWNAGNKTVVNGDYTRTGGTFVPGTGEIRFKGTGTHTIDAPVTESFFDVFFELSSGSRDAGGNLDKLYVRNLTMDGGVFNAPVEVEMVQLELNGGTYNAGATTKVSGNFENNAGALAYNPATGILEIGGGPVPQLLGGSFPTTFYKLHTSNTSGGVEVTDDIFISNELCILSGILINNASITNTGTKCDGGVYMGSGTYTGSVFDNDGGTIAPGGSPGCTIFGSGLDNTGGTISIEITGTTVCTQYDQVQVTGTAILGGGTLTVTIPSYTPSCGETYTILTATTAVTGTFGTINYPALPSGLGWSIQYNATSVVLTIVGTNEINVKGNSVSIADGDATPDLADHTEFGNVSTSGSLMRTYTIENTGTDALTISSITKSGADAGLFTLGALTPASPIPAAGSATFTVTFAPTTTGLKTATISINNNDCDEAVYNYDVQGTGAVFSVHNITQGTDFTTIQAAINDGATVNGDHITVDAGLYNEDVTVNKQLRIQGADAATTTVRGPIGGAGSTFTVAASGVIIEGLTITRDGNNTTDWNDAGLNIAGVAVQGLTADAEVRNCIITGMRTGIDINNSNGNNIHNNTIDNNRTGLIFRNQTDNTVLEENFITNNWTVGVLFLDASGGSNVPVQQALNSSFRYNNISGNWYGQVVDRQTGGSLPAPGANLKNFKCNWYGTTSPVTSTANSAEPGYAVQIPVIFGGTAVAPGGQPDILGAASANIIYQPYLNSGTDNAPATSGFQPVPGSCAGCATGALVTNINTGDVFCSIQSAIDDPFTLDGHILTVAAGTFAESVSVTKSLTLRGPNALISPNGGVRVAEAVITGGLTISNLASRTVVIEGFQFNGATSPMLYNGNQPGTIALGLSFRKNLIMSSGQFACDLGTATNSATLLVDDNKFMSMTSNAIQANTNSGGTLEVTMTNNTIDGTTFAGINTNSLSNSLISSNTISNTVQQGIQIAGAASNVTVSNNVISNANTSSAADRGGIRLYGTAFTGAVNVINNAISSSFNGVAIRNGENITGKAILVNNNSLLVSGGKTIYHGGTGLLNGECNWHGSAVAATVAASVSANVDIISWLTNATDNDLLTTGFQPVPASCTGVGPVLNVNTSITYFTIQSAIDDPLTLDGHTLEVSPGTYDEQVLVNKQLIIKGVGSPQPEVNFTGTVSGKPTLFDISADMVTIENIHFNVDMSKLRSAIIASSAGLDNITVKDNVIDAYGTPGGSYGDRNAVSINYGGSTNYRVATGGVDNILFQGNTVNGTGPSSYFRSGISADEAGGTFSGNTLLSINHDILLRFASNGPVTISNNNFNGGGVELADQNAASGAITVSGNIFTGAGAPGAAVLRIKNNYNSIPHVISGNTFNNYEWGISAENMNSISIDGNTFATGSATARALVVNTKSLSSNSNSIVQVPVAASITNNNFNGSGNALTFLNHDSDNDSYGIFTLGTAGNENNFAASLSSFILFDAQTGSSNGSTFPVYLTSGGWPTTMACWDQDMNAQNNKFDVGAGLQLPSAMNFAGRTTLESKLTHKTDNTCLGLMTYFFPVHNITQSTYYMTIQAAVNAAVANDVIECAEWEYKEKVTIDKTLTLQGVNETNCVINGAGLGNGSGIIINNGVTGVTIRYFTIKNHAGIAPNNYAGIYAIGGNNGLLVEHCTIKDNVGGCGFYANGPINGITLDDLDVSGHTNAFGAARGIVIWNGLKENITITNCEVYNNNCCGIELQDGTASGVTMTGNNVHDNGDNGIGLNGLNGATGANLVSGNTVTNNGRYGIEVKNPNANGANSGTGSFVITNNTVSFTASVGMNNRDHAGISVYRRAFLAGNTAGYPNIPTGVVVTGNTVSGYQQLNPGSTESKGYGIVIEGTNHKVTTNTLNNNDIGIQEQGGAHPNPNYVANDAGDGDQADGASANYFGRGNAPVACGNTISGNIFSGNTTDQFANIGAGSFGLVRNSNTGETFCSIQAAIDDAQTVNGHTLEVYAGTYTEAVTVNKELTITGAGKGSNPASNSVLTAPTACTGTGFTISAANVTIQNMYVTGFQDAVLLNGISSPTINNMALIDYCRYGVNFGGSNTDVEITGTDIQRTSFLAGTIGMRIGTANAVNGLLIDNCTITGNALQGIVNFQATTPVAFDNITIRNSTISNNLQKGLYFEKLSNALLENLTMDNNGTDATYGFNNGIDINLKYGSYSNITIQNCDITNSGVNGTATDPQNAAVIAIKARDDSPSYSGNPASLSNVLIKNNRITGPQNGIRLGEFGKLNATPTNVTIEGNDLSHAFAGKAIISRINADATVICNWHGSTNLATILATFTEAGSGNLLLGTVLGSGTDASAAVGFQPLASCVCANGNLVTNTTTLATYCSIQAAIDDPLTLDGHTLQVGAGTYIENVIVNKQLSILGPNAAIDACSGTRVAEAIVVPATAAISSGEIFHVAASNVTISGFTIDGDNTALTSGFTSTNGADIDAAEGITVYETGVNNLTVTNNIIQNLSYFGVTLYDYPAAVPSSGHLISNNKIQDLGTYDGTSGVSFWGGGVLLYNNQYAAVTNNCMTNVRLGVQTGNFHLANPGALASQQISGNTIAARRRGIFHNLFYGSASPYTLSNNTITGIVHASETVWDGILLSSQAIASTASGNIINGTGIANPSEGIEVWNSLPAPLISGGNISNVGIGISVNNYEGYASNANNTAATISGVTISAASNAGIKVHDNVLNTNGATASADIQGNTVINTTTRGLVITGAGASAVFTGANPASFTGQTVYIDLESNGTDVPAGNIDATAVLFDGQTGATATFAQNFAIEDKINHKIENQALGFVTVKASNAFVTDIAAPAATNNDYTRIRNAVGLVSNNWNINLKGTFDWTEANAATSWSLGNDAIVSAADDYSILVPANLNGITFTAPEGLGTATIQGPGDLATANLEAVLVFDGGDNQNWTISNLELFDIDMPLGFFNGAGGTDAFNGTTISNNHIRIPKDLNTTAAPADPNQNIGIHYSFGVNQTISGNTFTVDGTGTSAGASRSTSIVMQSNTSGGTAYDGLKIINNTVIVTGDPDPTDPAVIRGFWENGHNTDADIEISGNIFSNASSTNLASQNRQFGMWQTSHSGATKNVVYKNNEFTGWNTGISSLGGLYTVNTPPGYETGEMPVLVQNNKFDKVQYGVVVRKSGTSSNPGSPFVVNENSFTNPVAGGFAVSNESSGLTNAECNWYGSVLPGVVSGSVSANVDVIPFLVNGTDNSAATGFQPVPGSCTGIGPVLNTNTLISYFMIQSAIDDPLTLDGHTITVAAGTYAENVIVNKQLSILGPNAAIDPCSGTRVAEAIVVPATAAISSGEIFHVAASNVTISGFTIDGDNTALTSGFTSTTAADIDAAEGITVYETGVNNLMVTNNIIQNLSYFGVTLYDYPAAVPSSGHVIANNKIRDLGTYDAGSGVSFWGGGVLLYNNQYAAVTNNCMTNVRIGVQTGNFHLANPGALASQQISGNTIAARRRGIFHNLFYGSASPYTLSNNTITGIVHASESLWDGILIASQAIASTASNNSINGTGITNPSEGIEVWNSLPAPLISGGTVTGVGIGVSVNNFEGYASNANNTAATIDGVTITGASIAGIKVHDNPLNTNSATVSAEIKGNCSISGSPAGILVTGSDAAANIHDNSASITGNTVGVDIDNSATVSPLYRNNISTNGTGVRVRNGGNLGLTTENFITNNTVEGIRIEATAGTIGNINSNDLSGNTGLALNNLAAALVNATCNWYGSNVPATVAAEVSANVTYIPYLSAGTDDGNPANGFQPAVACSAPCTTTVGGPTAVCVGANITMTTSAASGSWASSDPTKATIDPGTGVITGVAAGTVTFTFTELNGCSATTATVTVHALPVPTITGPSPVCTGSAGHVYTTEAGMSAYVWNVTGGVVTGGGTATDHTITITWGVPGTGHVTVLYTDPNGCTAAAATDYPVTINALPAVTISGAATVCSGSTGNIYSTQSGQSNYVWTVTGGTISAGGGSGDHTVTVTWGAAGAGQVTVNYTAPTGCSATAAAVYPVTINPIPDVANPGNQLYCNHVNTTPIVFSSSTTGPGTVSFTWTNNNTAIGLAASGSGDIPSFLTTNASFTTAITATIVVTPHYTYNSVICDGPPQTFTITVQPASNGSITGASNTTICAGQGASINVVLNGVPNFTGSFRIREILDPIGPVFGPAVLTAPSFSSGFTGLQAVAVPGSFLPNTTALPKIYRLDWNDLTDGNGCTAYPMLGFVDITVSPSVPVFTFCPAAITNIPVNAAGCVANYTTPNPVVTVNCGSLVSLTWAMTGATTGASSPAGVNYVGTQAFNVGTTTITYTATDVFGHTATCSYTVQVVNTLTGTVSGSVTVVQDVTSSPVTFSGSGGTLPYTFTYKVNAGPDVVVTTTGGSSSVVVSQPNNTVGSFVYTLVSITDANGCTGALPFSTSATVTVVNTTTPDLTSAVSQPLNSTFFTGQVKEGFVTLSNVTPNPTTGTITFRVSLVANFDLEILGSTIAVTPPGSVLTAVNNNDWDITAGPIFYTISSKPGVVINGGSSVKIGYKLTATGGANSSGLMTVTILNGTGGSTPLNGDNNNSNNQSVKLFGIN